MLMFETTRDFYNDAVNFQLEDQRMLDVVLVLTGVGDSIPLGQAVHDFHKLAPKQRNYICCVLLERDADPNGWERVWSNMEAKAFE